MSVSLKCRYDWGLWAAWWGSPFLLFVPQGFSEYLALQELYFFFGHFCLGVYLALESFGVLFVLSMPAFGGFGT